MKKKLLSVFFVSTLVLGACGGENTSSENDEEVSDEVENLSEDTEAEDNEDGKVEVDKKIINVDVTIPASLLEFDDDEEIDIDEIKKEAKESGIKKVVQNDDDSVTYTMSKSTHRELLDEMEKGVEETIDEIINDEDFISIKDIKVNKNYDKYELIVDKEGFENSLDGFGVLGVALNSMYYQLFEGVEPDDYEVIIDIKDEETGEVFDTVIFPDALEEE